MILTDCCVKTQEEVDAILEEYARIYVRAKKKQCEQKYFKELSNKKAKENSG